VKLTIVDANDAVISKASIVIYDQAGHRIVEGQSDGLGTYQALELGSGSWKITVSAIGFAHKDLTVFLREREIFQSVIKLDVVTTVMGVIVEVDNSALPPEAQFSQFASAIPDYIPYSATPPDGVSPKAGPSRSPIARLLRKLHF